jgi:hypothetical protein
MFVEYQREIDNCKLMSVGKGKYPFECFGKAAAKNVNYVKVKKPLLEENPGTVSIHVSSLNS